MAGMLLSSSLKNTDIKCKAIMIGVGGSVSGRLDGHAVDQQTTAPLL